MPRWWRADKPTGSSDKNLEVSEPWQLRVPIDEITPRSYGG